MNVHGLLLCFHIQWYYNNAFSASVNTVPNHETLEHPVFEVPPLSPNAVG